MELTFLGTSAGVPTRERNVFALALRPDQRSGWNLFDCGEATQHQIMRSELSLYRLERIFITHLHGDHVYGLFGLLASRGMMMCEAPLSLYGPPGLRELSETVMRLSELRLPYELEIVELSPDTTLSLPGVEIKVLALSHSITSYGYCWIEAQRPGRFDRERARALGLPEGPLYGKLKRGERVVHQGRTIEPAEVLGPPRPGRRIAIAGDNDRPEIFGPCAPLDLLVHEATYLQEDFDKLPRKFRHTTALQLGKAAEEIGVRHLVATHFSPRYGTPQQMQKIKEEIEIYYRGKLTLAEDFMKIVL
ncbi:ribonuclease Z [Nitratifractor sp.]